MCQTSGGKESSVVNCVEFVTAHMSMMVVIDMNSLLIFALALLPNPLILLPSSPSSPQAFTQ